MAEKETSATQASRAAVRHFLKQVGVGGTFTMQQLRQVVPDAEQVGRRMRELRQAQPTSWLIASSQSDRTLPVGTYRLDRIGGDKIPSSPSSRIRREVFEASGNRCQVCGIGVGEEYAEFPGEVARLQLGHWVPLDQGGNRNARGNLRAECHRCNGGIGNRTGAFTSKESVLARIRALARRDRVTLLNWLKQRKRDVSDSERLFYEIRQLPPEAQDEAHEVLEKLVHGDEG